MNITGSQLITQAYSDIGGLRPGQTTSTDVLALGLTTLNQLVGLWAQERLFVLKTDGTTLATFDLGTTVDLSDGAVLALRKNLAVRIAPALRIYFKIPEPLLQEVAAEAEAAKTQLSGVGIAPAAPPTGITATALIHDALTDIGCLVFGQGATADLLNGCFRILNQQLESFLLDDLMCFTIRIDAYNLVAGQQVYTIGPSGADFTAARPTRIEEANLILNTVTPVVRRPLKVIQDQGWANIRVQSIPFALPLKLYYDGGFNPASGYASLYLWPGPLSAYQLELFTWEQLQSFANLTTAYRFPPGYELLLRKTLALAAAPACRKYLKVAPAEHESMVAQVRDQAVRAMAAVQSFNAPDPTLAADPALRRRGRGWNYAIGE